MAEPATTDTGTGPASVPTVQAALEDSGAGLGLHLSPLHPHQSPLQTHSTPVPDLPTIPALDSPTYSPPDSPEYSPPDTPPDTQSGATRPDRPSSTTTGRQASPPEYLTPQQELTPPTDLQLQAVAGMPAELLALAAVTHTVGALEHIIITAMVMLHPMPLTTSQGSADLAAERLITILRRHHTQAAAAVMPNSAGTAATHAWHQHMMAAAAVCELHRETIALEYRRIFDMSRLASEFVHVLDEVWHAHRREHQTAMSRSREWRASWADPLYGTLRAHELLPYGMVLVAGLEAAHRTGVAMQISLSMCIAMRGLRHTEDIILHLRRLLCSAAWNVLNDEQRALLMRYVTCTIVQEYRGLLIGKWRQIDWGRAARREWQRFWESLQRITPENEIK
jgi:hypothetical protein